MNRIIVVEDNEAIRESVVSYLKLENYEVLEFERASGVFEACRHKKADVLILDVMLPDGNGFLLAKRIKEDFEIPIIFLTAKTAESDRITGFEIGCDDYIVKPFSVKELVLRVKALLKRTGGSYEARTGPVQFHLGASVLSIDKKKHLTSINGLELNLTAAEWEILIYLAEGAGIVIARSRLLGECLDYMAEGAERTIDTHIKNIRAKLADPAWIETVRGYGYRFTGIKE